MTMAFHLAKGCCCAGFLLCESLVRFFFLNTKKPSPARICPIDTTLHRDSLHSIPGAQMKRCQTHAVACDTTQT
ncbi:hypothetical protein BC940DRAFT_298598 [Gongronella butleri]|nr:hypothetical protein BC940DRAFT_298598 [Gongronella butleri]